MSRVMKINNSNSKLLSNLQNTATHQFLRNACQRLPRSACCPRCAGSACPSVAVRLIELIPSARPLRLTPRRVRRPAPPAACAQLSVAQLPGVWRSTNAGRLHREWCIRSAEAGTTQTQQSDGDDGSGSISSGGKGGGGGDGSGCGGGGGSGSSGGDGGGDGSDGRGLFVVQPFNYLERTDYGSLLTGLGSLLTGFGVLCFGTGVGFRWSVNVGVSDARAGIARGSIKTQPAKPTKNYIPDAFTAACYGLAAAGFGTAVEALRSVCRS